MIKYKVVGLFTRCSCFAQGKYRLFYGENTTVISRKETFGIAVFEREYQAKNFIETMFGNDDFVKKSHKIIHVKPIGRGKHHCFVSSTQFDFDLDRFYNHGSYCEKIKVPPGTIFYPAVEVLD